jgi:hypothetical protein
MRGISTYSNGSSYEEVNQPSVELMHISSNSSEELPQKLMNISEPKKRIEKKRYKGSNISIQEKI